MITIYPNEHQFQMTFNCCLDYKNLKPSGLFGHYIVKPVPERNQHPIWKNQQASQVFFDHF